MRPVALVLAFVFVACSTPEHDPSQWPVARVDVERAIPSADPAEQTYRTHCIACHGVDGRGAGGATGANFTAPDGPLTKTDDVLLASILDGRVGTIGVMPSHRAILGEARARAVLAYVRAHFGAGIVPLANDAGVDTGP